MNDKLKPCPFCGGKAILDETNENEVFVGCYNCYAHTGLYCYEKDAIEAWNNRIEPTFTLDELDAIRRNVIRNCVLLVRDFSKIEQSIIDKCNDTLKGGSVE